MLSLIIFGWSTSNETLEQGEFPCPICRGQRACGIVQTKRWITLYFLPVLPLGRSTPKIVCRGCQGEFAAPLEISYRHPSTNPLPWILGIGAAGVCAFLLFCTLVLGLVAAGGSKGKAGAVAMESEEPFDGETGDKPRRTPAKARPGELGKKDLANPAAKSGPRNDKPAPPRPSRAFVVPDVPWNDGKTSDVGAVWEMKADPAKEPVSFAVADGLAVPIGAGSLHFPPAPSRFVAVRHAGTEPRLELWDLSTGQRTAVIKGFSASSDANVAGTLVVARDGGSAALAARDDTGLCVVRSWEFSTGRARDFAVEPRNAPAKVIHLLDRSRFLAATADGNLALWDMAADRAVAQIPLPADASTACAVSPGGRYAALATRDSALLWIADLDARKPAGRIPLPKSRTIPPSQLEASGFCFSPDGKKLAGLFREGSSPYVRLIGWDLETAGVIFDGAYGGYNLDAKYPGQQVEFVEDWGYLLAGRLVVAPRPVDLLGLAPPLVEGIDAGEPRRALDRQHLLMMTRGAAGERSLSVVKLVDKVEPKSRADR